MKSKIIANSAIKSARTLACVAALLLAAVAAAQATTVKQPSSLGKGLGFAYDLTHEITFVGTVQSVVSRPAHGSPFGFHLLVSTSGKVVDAHLGPYISKENQEALHIGELVQIIGVNERVHGRNVLLARQLVFAGRQVTVRNERGFLVRAASQHKISDGNRAVNGGTQ
jgi:hypothetical protein